MAAATTTKIKHASTKRRRPSSRNTAARTTASQKPTKLKSKLKPKFKLVVDPAESAKIASLRYSNDDKPGITRKKSGKSFRFFDSAGKPLRDKETVARIRALAIPPAWTDVWISPYANGHLQATGRDVRGRKQYRYHARWRTVRDESKYTKMILFGAALPAIRKRVDADMSLPGLTRTRVLATLVRLLETTLIRIGNEEYARTNGSFGLTTMQDQHVDVSGSTVQFKFRGKSGKTHSIKLADRRAAKIVSRCQDLPGQELFQYIDDAGEPQTVDSSDVNAYLQSIAGEDFTAKDFRTWAGTVLAALALREFERFDTQTQAKSNVVKAIENVAERLGNTPSICRKCYVHPAILDSYLDGSMLSTLEQRAEQVMSQSLDELRPEEAAVMGLLQQRLKQSAKAG